MKQSRVIAANKLRRIDSAADGTAPQAFRLLDHSVDLVIDLRHLLHRGFCEDRRVLKHAAQSVAALLKQWNQITCRSTEQGLNVSDAGAGLAGFLKCLRKRENLLIQRHRREVTG